MSPLLAQDGTASIAEMDRLPVFGWEVSPTVAAVLAGLFHAGVLFALFGVAPFAFIWAERKVSGRIQDRLGPTRVGGRFGWLQSLADGVKLIQKEDLVPTAADGMLFRMAPYLVCIASFAAFMVLPFSDGWMAVASDIGLFVLVAYLSLEVFGIILAGYSSGSKWSLFGGMREAAQMVSYEIPLAICALVPVISVGTLNLNRIGGYQDGWLGNWLLFHDPFTFVAFFVYFTVATASCKRAPFDLAEAESELVGGFHTEYSGMRWSFFFLAEYASMFLVSLVAAILFLGGWNSGLGFFEGWMDDLAGSGGPVSWLAGFDPASYVANLVGMTILLVKASVLVLVQIWVRWTFPRLRIDQVMTTCLKYLVPISCFLFLGATVWPLVVGNRTMMCYGRSQVVIAVTGVV
jgi:NADH-quinone oxidoreductase subunit H